MKILGVKKLLIAAIAIVLMSGCTAAEQNDAPPGHPPGKQLDSAALPKIRS
jgi:uncharacterized protein YceK